MSGKVGEAMISYEPFWNTLKLSEVSTYTLINKYHISAAIIDKLRHNKPLNTKTLDDLCQILDCELSQVAVYTKSQEESTLP